MQAKHPCALSHFSEFISLLRGKRLAVFLDYDGAGNASTLRCSPYPFPNTRYQNCNSGTLTPIVPNPEDAILSEQVRKLVEVVVGESLTCKIMHGLPKNVFLAMIPSWALE